jgi:transposase
MARFGTAAHSEGIYLAALYHHLAARRGKKRAIVAVAYSIIVSAFHRLSRHEPHSDGRSIGSSVFSCWG